MQAVFGGKFSSNLIDKIVKDVPYNHIMWCKISKNFNLCILKNNTDSYRQVKLANANAACMYCGLLAGRPVWDARQLRRICHNHDAHYYFSPRHCPRPACHHRLESLLQVRLALLLAQVFK